MRTQQLPNKNNRGKIKWMKLNSRNSKSLEELDHTQEHLLWLMNMLNQSEIACFLRLVTFSKWLSSKKSNHELVPIMWILQLGKQLFLRCNPLLKSYEFECLSLILNMDLSNKFNQMQIDTTGQEANDDFEDMVDGNYKHLNSRQNCNATFSYRVRLCR